jgi:hypothetical protein
MKISTANHDLIVRGLSFETTNTLTGEAICAGFDLLVIDGIIEVNSIDELFEHCAGKAYNEIMTALNAQAQIDRTQWYNEDLPKLRRFLHG